MNLSDVAAPIIPAITSNTRRLASCSAVNGTIQLKMSTDPNKEQSDKQKKEDVEIKIVPEGTFAETKEKPILVKKGKPEPEDTGDQGEGQN
jgi:hypothetical protein